MSEYKNGWENIVVEYDAGGWIEPGVSVVINNGPPEPILDPKQWRRDE